METRKVIEGTQRDYLLLVFELLGPNWTNSMQKTIVETYNFNGKTYYVTRGVNYYGENDPLVEEVINYDF